MSVTVPQTDVEYKRPWGENAILFIVCLCFLLIILLSPVLMVYISSRHVTMAVEGPDFPARVFLNTVSGLNEDTAKLVAFITPVFAMLAGLKSRHGTQTWFFLTFVLLCLAGAVLSLYAKYYIVSGESMNIFKDPAWIGGDLVKAWSERVKTFFSSSFDVFLSFISVLLGIRIATGEKGGG